MGLLDYVKQKKREHKISQTAKRVGEAEKLKQKQAELAREAKFARERHQIIRDIDKSEAVIKAEKKARFERSFLGKTAKGLQKLDKNLSKVKVTVKKTPSRKSKAPSRKSKAPSRKSKGGSDIFGDMFGGGNVFGSSDIGLFPEEKRRKRRRR